MKKFIHRLDPDAEIPKKITSNKSKIHRIKKIYACLYQNETLTNDRTKNIKKNTRNLVR